MKPTLGVLLAALAAGDLLAAAQPFDPGMTSFTVEVRGESNPYRVLGLFVAPAEVLDFRMAAPAAGGFDLQVADGAILEAAGRRFRWRAPATAGLYPVRIRELEDSETMTFNVFVHVPASQVRDGHLNGYRLGSYPATALRGLAIYRPPRGFVEVTARHRDTPVSPHFTLGQFLCKQAGDFPKYVVLRTRLLLKLEYLLQRVNEQGYRCDTFFVMSGFRTPFYNTAIGNVKYSRHQWGGAADIFIDENPKDGKLDDLDGDGRSDRRDAELLYRLVESLQTRRGYEGYVGGLGLYGASSAHGPFIHVDVRGFRARWGQ